LRESTMIISYVKRPVEAKSQRIVRVG
jgi:hypothetical protein